VKLDNKVAIVTGAGRNIGEAIAELYADEGARVAVVDLDEGAARRVADAINAKHPGQAIGIRCDVSDSADVQRLVQRVVDEWRGIDVLVNNVAITDRTTILELSEEEWERVLKVTLTSQFLCSKYAAKQMVAQGRGGRIICLASTSGHRGRKDALAYTAAKGGVLNLARSMAIQLAPYNIRVNSVTPNRVGSPVGQAEMRTVGEVTNLVHRVGLPYDIAAMCLLLASNDGDFITGADMLVDGGALAAGGP
jgi:NAD(P)-dependent dehydrogenase (short-subunit alcohol dehydrogenase family)